MCLKKYSQIRLLALTRTTVTFIENYNFLSYVNLCQIYISLKEKLIKIIWNLKIDIKLL